MPTIQYYNKRWEALKTERSSFVELWGELSDYHLAHRGRFLVSDRNKGFKRNTKQYNNTSRLAVRTLSSGMMSGVTSPARPWFMLGTPDPDLREYTPVKEWLYRVQRMMYKVFADCGLYKELPALYTELGTFGTSAIGVYSDFDNVIRAQPYTIGSYALAINGKGKVDTFYREYEITVAQCVDEFGLDKCSQAVRQQHERKNFEAPVTVIHAVEPNPDHKPNSPSNKHMAFRSVYFERSVANRSEGEFLRESGFRYFPILTPRWDVVGEDVYATDCPGMVALGDTKALQLGERYAYQALEKVVNPPLQGPSSMKNKMDILRPGEIVWRDTGTDGLKSIYDFRPDLNAMQGMNQQVEQRVKRAFYEDLFLMLANTDRREITAREVAEKHEEKLLMLGPVLERLQSELLDPLIDITFDKLEQAGVLPEPPPEIQGQQLKVEYVSVLSQAQKAVSLGTIERLSGFVGSLAQLWPEARYKFDAQQAVDEYAESLGIPPAVVRSDDEVASMEEAEAQQAQQAQAMQQGATLAEIAKKTSETKVGSDDILGMAMKNVGANVGQP